MTDKLDDAKKEFEEIPEQADGDNVDLPEQDKVKKRSKKNKLLSEAEKLKKKISDELNDEKDLQQEIEPKKNSKNSIIQTIKYLDEHFNFRYNDILKITEFKRKEDKEYQKLDDLNFRDLRIDLQLAGIQISQENFQNIVYGTKIAKRFNPLREWLFNLPKWDGKTDYISDYFDLLELEDESKKEFVLNCCKKWVVGMVGSIVDDNEVNHLCLVLVGGQGTGKTTFLNGLVPGALRREYLYSNTFLPHQKDHILFLSTKWLINLDEFEAFNKVDIRTIKSVITTPQVEVRKAYAKESIIGVRIASFCGSINNIEFLNDDTGNRRFIPVHIKKVRYTEKKSLELMYAQALALYADKENFKHYISDKEIAELDDYNQDFKKYTMEEEMVIKHFRPPTETEIMDADPKIKYLFPVEIVNILTRKFERLNQNNTVGYNVGKILSGLGFNKPSKRIQGYDKPVKLWQVVADDNEVREITGEVLKERQDELLI